jgi:hypothetical protein
MKPEEKLVFQNIRAFPRVCQGNPSRTPRVREGARETRHLPGGHRPDSGGRGIGGHLLLDHVGFDEDLDFVALQEADMASAVQAELRCLGWDVIDDRTGPQVGNLFARRMESSGPTKHVLLATHLDVVEPCRGEHPGFATA